MNMDRLFLLLLSLPVLCRGQISVSIEASDSHGIANVHLDGSSWDIISDVERTSFGITDAPLKNAVERHSGGRPQDVFVRSPTPWNDLYISYGWPEVTRTLKPVRSRVVGVQSEPVIVTSEEYVNRSNVTSVFTAVITQEVQNTVASSWERGHQLSAGMFIEYNVRMNSGTGSMSMSFTSTWGHSSTHSQTVTLGSSAGVQVSLKPGQAIRASLTATRGSMTIEVDYEATLSGAVACNYPRKFNGHHFWAYHVNNVMRAGNLPTALASREVLRIGFYTTARLVVTDLKTRKVMYDLPVDITVRNNY